GKDGEMAAAIAVTRHDLVPILLLLRFVGLAVVLVYPRILPRVGIVTPPRLPVEFIGAPVTQLMIAHGVVLRRELAGHRAAVRVPVALGADGRGIDGAMRHGRVRRIGRKAKGSDLPVRGEAPLHDWIEHLHSVVLTVRTLQTVADAGTIRAHVVF